MADFVLTERVGPRVERAEFDSLDAALAALRERAEALRAGEDLHEVRMLRTFTPEQRVKARLEISAGGLLRRRDAGVDVMGDGTVVPYRGGIFRKELEAEGGGDGYDAVAEALRGLR